MLSAFPYFYITPLPHFKHCFLHQTITPKSHRQSCLIHCHISSPSWSCLQFLVVVDDRNPPKHILLMSLWGSTCISEHPDLSITLSSMPLPHILFPKGRKRTQPIKEFGRKVWGNATLPLWALDWQSKNSIFQQIYEEDILIFTSQFLSFISQLVSILDRKWEFHLLGPLKPHNNLLPGLL